MALDLHDCQFHGPALPAPFVTFELEKELTKRVQLLLLLGDPARPDSTVTIPLDPGWKRQRTVPDSLRFVMALARPEGLQALPDLVDTARLQQARVTKELRVQARQAVERF